MRTKIFFLIVLSVLCLDNLSAQKKGIKITITGTVMNASMQPIANALIMIDGQKTNSQTDAEGHYKIKINPKASKIGIFTFDNGIKEEDINGRTEINFNFGTASSQTVPDGKIAPGEEAVGNGYATVKKKHVTTDITKIDGTKSKYDSYRSISEMIEREVSGVKIGASGVIIQDSKDFFGSVPALIVVDGVTMTELPDIPPSSVKSIEVLKGTSAAIYGSRGYGGVVVIKTKIKND